MELRWTSAAQRGGCFIVDATRQGKRFPDSFSKTVPFWACVLNRAVHEYRKSTSCGERGLSLNERETVNMIPSAACNQGLPTAEETEAWDRSLHLPLWVSDTEKEKIESRIDEWVNILWAANADVASLSEILKKPLQPLWISQNTVVWLNEVPDAASWTFTPIILVSASQPLPRAQRKTDGDCGWSYIPGAADDEESWARGLTSALFWKHALSLIESSADECNRMVADIVEQDRVSRAYRGLEANQVKVKPLKKSCNEVQQDVMDADMGQSFINGRNGGGFVQANQMLGFHWIGETNLAIGSAFCGQLAKTLELFDCAINCGIESASLLSCFEPRCYLHLPVVDSKHDRFSLQNHLSRVVAFAKEKLRQQYSLLILCADGEDLSVCVCLTILLALFNGEGGFDDGSNFTEAGVTKWGVRQHLVYLCNFAPNARPSRGNLRQVFNFLSRNMMS